MINDLELFYILNGTEISLQNQKNELFLTLETSSPLNNFQNSSSSAVISNPIFKVSGIHPYLLNNDFDQEIRTISKFNIVLCSMPDYLSSKERSVVKYGDQVSLMLPNNLFIVATNDGNLKIQKLNGDQTLTSVNLPHNSKFTIVPPENKFPANKPLFFDDIIILRSSFGGNLALTTTNNSEKEYEKGGDIKIGNIDDINTGINSNSNIKIEECKWKLIKTDVPMIPSWHKKRKYLNNNINSYLYYLDKNFYKMKISNNNINNSNNKEGLINSREISTIIDKSKEKLSSLNSTEQDEILVNDLLLVMLGLEGKYIKRVVNTTSYKDFKVEFEVEPYLDNPTCDPPLLSLTNLILPMGYYYSSITYFLNMGSKPETGLVVKGFCDGLKKILREYILFVNQLEEHKNNPNSNINLQQLWWVCQPSIKLLECLHKLCQKCFMIKGGALLNIIYSSYLHENDTQIKTIYKYLLNKSFIPFFDMIKLWICHGFLENEHDFQEFMIFSPKSYIKEKLNDYYHDLFWETKFILSENNIPTFLQKIATKILFIGKSYNIIKECGKNIKCPYEQELEMFKDKENEDENDINDIIKSNFNIYKKNEIVDFNGNNNYGYKKSNQMIFETERIIEFENLIDKIYQWINDTLKNILFNEKDLILMIESFKKYYLMEAGDFYNDFIELNLDLLNKGLNKIKEENIYKKDENFIKLPMIKEEEQKNMKIFKYVITNMTVEDLKKYYSNYHKILKSNENDITKITSQLEKIDRIINRKKSEEPKENVKVVECVEIEPEILWPLNLIFSKKNIMKYKLLFRQLIRLKFIEKLLYNSFIIQQDYKELNIQTKLKDSFFLRDCMINFIKNLIYYLFNEVIEPNYIKLIKNLENAKSMEEVINYHEKFLDTCLNEGLIIDNLKGKLNDILNCCYYYCHLIYQYNGNIRMKSQEIISDIISKRNDEYKNEYMRKTAKNKEKNNSLKQAFLKLENSYRNFLDKLKNGYNNRLKSFLETIKKINDNHKTNLANLLIKIDYTNYYHEQFSQ
jgi:gamma-tubulin complex component 2